MMEVSPEDIRKYGLRALMVSTYPLCFFLIWLLEGWKGENLVCFIEVIVKL